MKVYAFTIGFRGVVRGFWRGNEVFLSLDYFFLVFYKIIYRRINLLEFPGKLTSVELEL